MCHSIPAARALQQAIPNNCTAKTLGPGERLSLGVQALAGHQSITGLAAEAGVSRKHLKFIKCPISWEWHDSSMWGVLRRSEFSSFRGILQGSLL